MLCMTGCRHHRCQDGDIGGCSPDISLIMSQSSPGEGVAAL